MLHPLISVIVLNWNGKQYLAPCLDSLLAQTWSNREVIVVDNGSTDGSVEFLRAHYDGKITMIENGRNVGFAEGVNLGIAAARGMFVALLNNDAVAAETWLAELVGGDVAWRGCGRVCLQDPLPAPSTRHRQGGALALWGWVERGPRV